MTVLVGNNLNTSTFRQAAADSLCLRAGIRVDSPHARAKEFRGYTLSDLARAYLKAFGHDPRGLSRAEAARMVLRAGGGGVYAHSTSDFGDILGDTISKSLGVGYQESRRSWTAWMRRRTVPDFKTITVNRLGEFPALTQVREGEEYTYATIGEEREVYALAKYGKMFDVTWESIVNDDLNAFARIPQMMGQAAGRLENLVAYLPIISQANGQTMADGATLFHANHNNLAGTPAAITVTSIGAAKLAMRTQTGVTSGVTINVEPAFLIVPASLETVARQFLMSVNDPAIAVAVPNIFANQLTLVVETMLETNAAYPGGDSNGWYLAANNGQVDTIEVAFLEGNEAPFIEEVNGSNIDGRRYKVRHVVGAKAIDWRGMHRNAGA